MRMVFGLVLVVGLALAGFAVYMTKNYFSQTQAALNYERELRAKTGPLVEVYVVNKIKKYGDTLTKDDVQLIYWPQNALPDHVFKDPKVLVKGDAVLFPENTNDLRYITRQMEKFEPILAEKVTEPGQTAGLTGQLAKGQGAFAIKVDVASGVSGFVQPGDHVDVYWTGAVGNNNDSMTRLIENGIKVIAVDQNADDGNGSATVARTVTVAATREQVARLAQAAATGKLALSLVNGADEALAGKVEVDGNSLLGITEQPIIAAAEPEKVCTVKTRKGADVVDTPIPCTN
ncbi:MAG: Flp pilus assembly protein CpaB [bacterium]